MANPDLPFLPSKQTQIALLQFCKQTTQVRHLMSLRQKLEYIDREFYRENMLNSDTQKSRLANRTGDKKKITDVVMPIMEPQIETSLSYLTSVFLTGTPVFGVVAPPDLLQDAKSMEAVIAENSVRGSWIAELLMFFRDGLKYNIHGLEVTWDQKTIYSPITEVTPAKQNSVKTKDVLWAGNCLKRLDMYNTFFDIRVAPHKVHSHGEFAGYVELYGRIALKQFLQDLPNRTNVKEALASSFPTSGTELQANYYIPQINPFDNYTKEKLVGAMDWTAWAGLNPNKSNMLDYKNLYEVITRYVRIIPYEFGIVVPRSGMPQIWKIITVNDQVIVYMERQTNAHNFLPMVFGQPYNDGLSYQTKGLGEKLIPLQDIASTSWNARLATQRRKVSDRALYDPLRVREADVNSDNPSAKIPVRSSVYGKDVKEAYHAIPFEDNESGSYVSDAREFSSFANNISGQNQAQQGQFVKGNKTKTEFEDTQNHASGRQRMNAIFIEAQTLTPVKEIIKLNILQYQPNGDVVNPIDGKTYTVDAAKLRQLALAFKISDGLTPNDKLINGDILKMVIQAVGTPNSPLQQEYKLGPMFSYLMSMEGADLAPFEYTQQEKLDMMKQRMVASAANTAAQTVASGEAPHQQAMVANMTAGAGK